jgi:hypothetical protein
MSNEAVALIGFVSLFALIFHPEDIHDAKIKTAE